MDAIELDSIEDLHPNQSAYIKPFRIRYKQNGKPLIWDLIKSHDSVTILLYNKTRNVLVFVKQFRTPVFLSTLQCDPRTSIEEIRERAKKSSQDAGYTLELCAGIIDKEGLSSKEIAREEILEETGYDPPLESLEFVTNYRSGVAVTGTLCNLFYCEVTDEIRVNKGGGIGDEQIEVIELSLEESRRQMFEVEGNGLGRTAGLKLALCWFFYEKLPTLSK